MSERSPILLLDGAGREPIEAVLIDGVTAEEIRAADNAWIPFSFAAIREAWTRGVLPDDLPQHWHWEWARKLRSATAASRFFGIECGGEMQGLMAIRTDRTCRLPGQSGLPLVYVDYLAMAPWNLPGLVTQPRFRRGGIRLIAAAVQASRDQGWAGRLGLHSLRQAETFYREVCGMTDLGVDDAYEHLRYFEMSPAQTALFLGSRGNQHGPEN